MQLNVESILNSPNLHEVIRDQSRALLMVHEESPRIASIFGTHQRWMLGNLAMSIYYSEMAAKNPEPVIIMARFLEQVRQYDVASVNTADAFMKELLVYGIALPKRLSDRRNRPVIPAPLTMQLQARWVLIHLKSLDALDGGTRLKRLEADESLMCRLHPAVIERALKSPAIRTPAQTWSLFNWLNNGGIALDWLLSGIEPADQSVEKVPTQLRSVPQMAEKFRLSRTHLTRKLREAEALGSIGWEGTRGRSTMWVSREFRMEYATSQAHKLAIFDDACASLGIR